MSNKLDTIICTIDDNHFAHDDPDGHVDEKEALAFAARLGWNTKNTRVEHEVPSMIGQFIDSGPARKRVQMASDYSGHPSWETCLIVGWDDVS